MFPEVLLDAKVELKWEIFIHKYEQLINNNILVDQLSALNTGLLSLLDIGEGAITEV